MHVPEWNCTKIADGNGGMQMNGIGSLNALSPHSDCFAIKFVTRILCDGFEGSQKQAVELQEFEGAASETRPSAFEFRRMETRIAVEEPTMPFPSHVSAPFMLGDELFMPDSVAPMAQAAYLMAEEGSVMTANQLETLRRQISVYATICQQLVEMHKASMSYRPALSGVLLPGQAMPFDSLVGTHKAPSRQRWAPSHSQLQILEKIFDQINGTPNKQKIKEITAELSQYGQITETNVYNWFQNRKARAKRKHQSTTQKDGDSGGDTDGDSIDKKVRVDTSPDNCSGHNSGGSSGVHAYDQDQTSCFRSDTYVNSSSGLQGMASGHYKGLGGKNLGGKA